MSGQTVVPSYRSKNKNVSLYLEDCINVMSKMEVDSVDLTVTSPPYDNLRTYKDSLEWNEEVWKRVIEGLYRITKEGGVVVWVVGDATIKGSETGTSFKQALYAVECGFNLETMIWEKTGSGCLGSSYYYSQNFEYVFLFVKGKPQHGELIKDRENKIKAGKARVNGGLNKEGKGETRVIERKPFGKRNNIWRFDTQKKSGHPAPFPEQLVNDHIISWSDEDDVVFDPFLGSGTTGKIALLNNRKFIGCEKVPEYFEIARNRIDQFTFLNCQPTD